MYRRVHTVPTLNRDKGQLMRTILNKTTVLYNLYTVYFVVIISATIDFLLFILRLHYLLRSSRAFEPINLLLYISLFFLLFACSFLFYLWLSVGHGLSGFLSGFLHLFLHGAVPLSFGFVQHVS